MARVAGDSRYYTFTLRNENTGRYVKEVQIRLPSSSTIVKEALGSSPGIIRWTERQVKDIIVGLATVHRDNVDDLMDTLTDADMLDEYLKENRLTPTDLMKEAAERGTREHKTLERLANIGLDDPEEAHARATVLKEGTSNPFEHAIATWWVNNYPHPIAAEKILVNTKVGYAGTTDLVYLDQDEMVEVLDLKTRRSGLGVYKSDEFQVDSYYLAYLTEAEAHTRGVLVAYDDGTYHHAPVSVPVGSFLDVKRVWDLLHYSERR